MYPVIPSIEEVKNMGLSNLHFHPLLVYFELDVKKRVSPDRIAGEPKQTSVVRKYKAVFRNPKTGQVCTYEWHNRETL